MQVWLSKIQWCRPWQIIILENFIDFSMVVWIPLKFKANSHLRNLWNFKFKFYFQLEVGPMDKVVHHRLILYNWNSHNFWRPGMQCFLLWNYGIWNRFGKFKSKTDIGLGPLVIRPTRLWVMLVRYYHFIELSFHYVHMRFMVMLIMTTW
jgi:hypothetical protein